MLPRPYDTAVRQEIKNISFYLNCAGVDSPANAPLAQLVSSNALIRRRSLVQAQQGARFTPRGALFIYF